MTYYAIAQIKGDSGSFPHSLRIRGYKSLEGAKKALDKSKWLGFVRKYGDNKPCYFKI